MADTSVWARKRHDGINQWFQRALLDDAVAICDMVTLELLYSARNTTEFDRLHEELSALHQCPIGPTEWRRALEVYQALSRQGGAHQRSVKHPDLLIAAAAESAGIPVVHYDEDFDRISGVTGQATRWVAPRGTL